MEVIKELAIGGVKIELIRDNVRPYGAKWRIHRDGDGPGSSTEATALDVLALMLIMGTEMDMNE